MQSPYANLPRRAFWRTGVAERMPAELNDIYVPAFKIDRNMKIATAGSCFAQHVGRTLREAGFNIIDTEPAPPGVSAQVAQRFGFGLYSARYGNIYTARQLLQLWRESHERLSPALPVWRRGDRFFDAQRPGIEPNGLPSEADVIDHRAAHLRAVRMAFDTADVIVFTFGLTEAWVHKASGTVYPTAPGTIAGDYDPEAFDFVNLGFAETLRNFSRFRERTMEQNPKVKFIVTVSPVPLTATASGQHVEVATTYSKSVLRAVCGELAATYANVDYYPSYEIITSQKNAGGFYAENLREVTSAGVATAMRIFLAAHLGEEAPKGAVEPVENRKADARPALPDEEDAEAGLICEDALLEAFRK